MKPTINMERFSRKSVERCLYYVRAEIIREGMDGLEHIDGVLAAYGLDPDAYQVPLKRPQTFKGRGSMRRAVMAILKQGGATTMQVSQAIADEHDLDVDDVWRRVGPCLSHLKMRGLVANDGAWRYPVWVLIAVR